MSNDTIAMYNYSAFSATQDGDTMEINGTLQQAVDAATTYAADAFPAWGYAGHGPKMVVRDQGGNDVHVERL